MKKGYLWLCAIISCSMMISARYDSPLSNSCGEVNALKKDTELLFFPSYAVRNNSNNAWQIAIHAWVFEPEQDSVKRKILIDVLKRDLGLLKGDGRSAQFDKMAGFLLVDQEQGHDVGVVIGGKNFCLGKTDRNGHVESIMTAYDRDVRNGIEYAGGTRFITFFARTSSEPQRLFNGKARILEKSGIMVVSDIDDTVKVTGVRDRNLLIDNTMCRPFKAVQGMAAFYRTLARNGAVFNYVSASPWQMYPPLSEFLSREGFPDGVFQLRYIGSKNISGLFSSSEKIKKPHIMKLMKEFPLYRFIFIGDSGEKDPEIYGECARINPAQVIGIIIRNVTDESRDSERMVTAFSGLVPGSWHLVKDIGDLPWNYRSGRILLETE